MLQGSIIYYYYIYVIIYYLLPMWHTRGMVSSLSSVVPRVTTLVWVICNIYACISCAQGNLAAVGAMEPGIELWDLDVLDAVEPVACLGGQIKAAANGMDVDAAPETTTPPARKKKKKKKKASPALVHGSHTDAVLGLAWNREFRNVLASASADTTVKVWDIVTQQCQHTLDHHRDKVQALQWHPTQHATLLSGGFDRQAAVVDARSPDGAPMTVPVSADVEAVAWATDSQFLVSSEDGMVALFDTRVGGKKGQTAVWRLQAHDKAACAVGVCPAALHVMVTASVDKKVIILRSASCCTFLNDQHSFMLHIQCCTQIGIFLILLIIINTAHVLGIQLSTLLMCLAFHVPIVTLMATIQQVLHAFHCNYNP